MSSGRSIPIKCDAVAAHAQLARVQMYSPDAVAAPSARAVGARVCVDVCACTRSAQGEASIASRLDATGQMTLGRSHTRAQMQRAHHARRRRGVDRFGAAQLGALLRRASTSSDTRAYSACLRRCYCVGEYICRLRVGRVHARTSTRAPTARARLLRRILSGRILRPEHIRAYSL